MSDFNQFENQNKLPNDPINLILGIGSILFVFLGCCCGLFTVIPGLIMGITGWVLSSKAINIYNSPDGNYSKTSFANTKTAKILAIIGTILNVIAILICIFWIVGIIAQPAFLEEYRQQLESMQSGQNNFH